MSDLMDTKNCTECMWVETCANARPSCYKPMKEYWTPNWNITVPYVQPTKIGDEWTTTTGTRGVDL